MFYSIISKIPMKISVPLLLTAPVIAVVIILSVIAYVEGKSTANELMAQNLAQIHEHIEKRLKNLAAQRESDRRRSHKTEEFTFLA